MYLSEPVVKRGFFFAPNDDETKYPGILTISDGGRIELELTSDETAFTSFDEIEIGRLIGVVEGGYVTLERCGYRTKNMSFPGMPATSLIVADMAFIGIGMPEPEKFQSMRFCVDGLSEWWNRSAFKMDHGNKFEDFTASLDIPVPVECALPDGANFKLSMDVKIPGSRRFPTMELFHQAFLQITPKESQPVEYFTELSHRITRFFAFVIGRPVAIHSLKVKIDDPQIDTPHKWLSIYFRSLNNPSLPASRRLDTREMLLSYPTIASRFETMLSSWLNECDNLGPALHHFYLVQDGTHSYGDTRFIAMAQALEAFHRRTSNSTKWPEDVFKQKIAAIIEGCPEAEKDWLKQKLYFSNEITLAERLEKMFSPFAAVFGGDDAVTEIVRGTKNTRNYHAHYDAKGAKKALKGAALVALTFRLQVLFMLCMAVRLGFTVEEAFNLTKSDVLARMLRSADSLDEDIHK